jgi:hypothetical protein
MIWFNSQKSRNQLKMVGTVVTCRKKRKIVGYDTAIYHNEQGNRVVIGKVFIEILDVRYLEHKEVFEKFLNQSGFDSVDDWIEEVLRLNRDSILPKKLVFLKVTLKDLLY